MGAYLYFAFVKYVIKLLGKVYGNLNEVEKITCLFQK